MSDLVVLAFAQDKFLNCVHVAAERWQQLDELLPLARCCAVTFCVTKGKLFWGWLLFHGEKALLFFFFLFPPPILFPFHLSLKVVGETKM